MPLHPSEQYVWDQAMQSFAAYDELDPIERAAQDLRIIRATRYLVLGDEQHDEDFGELLAQIRHEYIIEPEEVIAAMKLAEDRILREQA